jgi:hypothetical protein
MNDYPNDDQFEEVTIDRADKSGDGWDIGFDGRGLFCPAFNGEPKAGDTLRIYGKGLGFRFRGLFVNGVRVFYRTEAEDDEHDEIQRYGADAADWLRRWDEGRSVWSIEMGGLGPGYEQCIHIVAAEVVRFLLAEKPTDLVENYDAKWRDAIDKALWADERINALGLSGAQAGAGKWLGCRLYIDGPRKIMGNPEIDRDRHIQVSRTFPQLAVA